MSSNLTVPGSSCPAQPHPLLDSPVEIHQSQRIWGGSAEQLLEAGRRPRAGAQAGEQEGSGKACPEGTLEVL